MIGVVVVAAITAGVVGYTVGKEVLLNYEIDRAVEAAKSKIDSQAETSSVFVDSTDLTYVCLFGERFGLPKQNVLTLHHIRLVDNISGKFQPFPVTAKIVNCDTKEETVVPVDNYIRRKHYRLYYGIPFNVSDGYNVVLFYSNENPSAPYPMSEVINIEMDLSNAAKFIDGAVGGPATKAYLNLLEFQDAGVFGTIAIKEGDELVTVPKDTQIIFETSDDFMLNELSTITNDKGEFILDGPIVKLHYLGYNGTTTIYPQTITLQIVLPSGEKYSYEFDVSSNDQDKVKIWKQGSHPITAYAAKLLYREDIIIDANATSSS